MPRPPFTYKSILHDLAHLEPFTHVFQVAAVPGKPARSYRVLIEFTMHCYTKAIQSGDDPTLFYAQDRDGMDRMFNLERWALSKELPEIIRSLPEHRVWFANSRDHYKVNFVSIPVVTLDGSEVHYEVYFKVFRSGPNLRLEVESAYSRGPNPTNQPNLGRKIGFNVILKTVSEGRKLADLK